MTNRKGKIRPPVKCHGGKHYLAPWIVAQFPPHRVYVEPFGGGASVLLNKPPCPVEHYNDLDGRIVRLFRVLRDNATEFQLRASLTLYSQDEFNDAVNAPGDVNARVENALRDFIRWRQSFGGQGKSWSCTTFRARGGIADCVNGWWTAIEGLPEVIARIQRVQITKFPAAKAITKFDAEDALIYCDPPYIHETREANSRDAYACEMTDADHKALAHLLNSCKGKVVVSGYRCDRYDEWYSDWRRLDREMPNNAAGGKTKGRKIESLWMNY